MRVEVTATTTKVESYNNFSDWFSFGGDNMLTENDQYELEKRNHYLDLIADSAIYQNVVDMSRIIKKLARAGLEFNREDLAGLSPYLTRHIKRFGEYVIDLNTIPDPWDGVIVLPNSKPSQKTGT
jgi:hypothetical protein